VRQELCLLIQRRNELAKLEKTEKYSLPPILNNQECTKCYVNKICSLHSLSLEQNSTVQINFEAFKEVEQIANEQVRAYFGRWLDIIQLEQ
jgi:hypothetical protein